MNFCNLPMHTLPLTLALIPILGMLYLKIHSLKQIILNYRIELISIYLYLSSITLMINLKKTLFLFYFRNHKIYYTLGYRVYCGFEFNERKCEFGLVIHVLQYYVNFCSHL